MADYSQKIKYLAENTKLSNSEIAAKLGCSKRTVRRHAGPYSRRLWKFFGIKPEDVAPKNAKVLIVDIETAPMEVFVWSLRQHGWINPDNIIKDWSILCWSAKWLFDDKMMSMSVRPDEAVNRQDGSIINELWTLLDDADILVAHNGRQFDVRRMNARFKLNGLKPTMPYQIIDTLRVSKRQFDFAAYNLDYLNGLFGLEQKNHPGFKIWKRCVEGDSDALNTLREYCENDVRILEEHYVQIKPWVKGHPNLGLYVDADGEKCTNCGSTKLDWRGFYFTNVGRYRAFRCLSCGAVGRSRISDLTGDEREKICSPLAV